MNPIYYSRLNWMRKKCIQIIEMNFSFEKRSSHLYMSGSYSAASCMESRMLLVTKIAIVLVTITLIGKCKRITLKKLV